MMGEPHGAGMGDRARQPVDYDGLAEFLDALAYPVRLELLDKLRFPHTLAEIKLSPRRVEPGGNPQRAASKSTVRDHLHKLVEAGLVREEEVPQAGKLVPRYEANPQRMYALSEDLRRLTVRYAGRGPGRDATGTIDPSVPPPPKLRGPRLVLVHGVYEGKTFPLDAATRRDGAWIVGRRHGIAVGLDYDPYVSLENSAIAERGGAYALTDLKGSKNGTSLNWGPLARGASEPLASGDVIGVGRSLLVFRAS
ncbi:MAG TPA: FHA domain-containing protein [Candidatus Thermoplasmatota archaeon]|jgi:DNA-binding transcriptional ArsR family regulator|nr:FHA domain-containing protein [Candidatus Thermoplasmatota archaeon]